jgi:hypothetical protein
MILLKISVPSHKKFSQKGTTISIIISDVKGQMLPAALGLKSPLYKLTCLFSTELTWWGHRSSDFLKENAILYFCQLFLLTA